MGEFPWKDYHFGSVLAHVALSSVPDGKRHHESKFESSLSTEKIKMQNYINICKVNKLLEVLLYYHFMYLCHHHLQVQ